MVQLANIAATTKLPHDAVAYAASAAIMVATVESVKVFARRGVLSSYLTRKLMHMAAGPVFILTWPFFKSRRSGWVAAGVPLAMTLKFALVGLGILQGPIAEADVRTMSRTGRREELLRGPVLYGVVFVMTTGLFFRDMIAAAAMMALCFGDGMADVVGRRYGTKHKLPWSPRKSWAGSGAFLLCSYLSSLACAAAFQHCGWTRVPLLDWRKPLALACVAGATVESLPMADIDNILVPAAVAATLAAVMA
jgi:dolichol kinase